MDLIQVKQKIINALTDKQNKNIAITFHFSPDADAIGSAVALALALQTLDKQVDIITPSYSSIFNPILKNINIFKAVKKYYDLCILVDCSTRERTINLDTISKLLIVIDHHYNSNELIGNYYYNIPWPANTMIIFDLLLNMNIIITPQIATALYLGIFGDTAGFTNSNTNSLALYYASLLLEKHANINLINRICKIKSLAMLKLINEAFTHIIHDSQYNIVYLVLMKEDLKKYNVTYDVVEYLMEELKNIAEADVAFLFIESTYNTKIKARSRGNIFVNEIMAHFEGNGFPHAAGAVIASTNIYQIVDNVILCTKNYINKLKK